MTQHQVALGSGLDTFRRASAALRAWTMFEIPWLELVAPARLEAGATVGVLARVPLLGLWCLNACRIVYCDLDDASAGDPAKGESREVAFAYGTLPGHVAAGEERFSVGWSARDDRVHYRILAYSRPHKPLTWMGLPVLRRTQHRFSNDSMAAMQRASQP